eukprot:TRINITY_DN7940_c0_g1_i3.p1 TRINITY_DN7940_c0_g1~~TRINITY_DN7940_c0_g1_i3.p1  ORF type:complete len:324 (-),score=46.63 TRINITY_DN7940_c0_g1_i3:187-1158(-)
MASSQERRKPPEKPQIRLSLKQILLLLNSEDEQEIIKGLSAFSKQIAEVSQKKKGSTHESTIDQDDADETPLLLEYLKGSPECNEIFSIWAAQQKNYRSRVSTSAMEVLAAILTHNDFSPTKNVNSFVGRKVFKEFLKNIYSCLASEFAHVVGVAFRLLTGVVSSNTAVARDLFHAFNWGWKPLQQMADKRSKTPGNVEQNVRTHFVRFATAFVRVPDPSLTEELLAMMGFVSTVFKGLRQDPPELAWDFLDALQTNVVATKEVSRKVKAAFFNGFVLEQIAKLYKSSGNKEGRKFVERVHQFLMNLCCGPDGLCRVKLRYVT